jgi:hypothetical protein
MEGEQTTAQACKRLSSGVRKVCSVYGPVPTDPSSIISVWELDEYGTVSVSSFTSKMQGTGVDEKG